MAINIPELWTTLSGQCASVDDEQWNVARLVKAAEEQGLPVFDYDLRAFNSAHKYNFTWHEFAAHMRKVQDADLCYPIILHPNGTVMDGVHRIVKAIVAGFDTVKVVQFSYSNLPYRDRVRPEDE